MVTTPLRGTPRRAAGEALGTGHGEEDEGGTVELGVDAGRGEVGVPFLRAEWTAVLDSSLTCWFVSLIPPPDLRDTLPSEGRVREKRKPPCF